MLACKGGQAKMKMKLLPSQASCRWNEDTVGFFYCKTLADSMIKVFLLILEMLQKLLT
jgi:hypothetical protein